MNLELERYEGQLQKLRKAAEMALEALDCLPWQASPIAVEATKALRQALAQEQRPVGTYEGVMEAMLSLRSGTLEQQQVYGHMKDKLLYTAPPKREWKGLTSDDKHFLLANAWNKEQAFDGFMEAIDKFLEEKNT